MRVSDFWSFGREFYKDGKDEGGWRLGGVAWRTVERHPIELGLYYETREEGDAFVEKLTNSPIDPNDPQIHGRMQMSNCDDGEMVKIRWCNRGYFWNCNAENAHDIMRPSIKRNELLRKKKMANLYLK